MSIHFVERPNGETSQTEMSLEERLAECERRIKELEAQLALTRLQIATVLPAIRWLKLEFRNVRRIFLSALKNTDVDLKTALRNSLPKRRRPYREG